MSAHSITEARKQLAELIDACPCRRECDDHPPWPAGGGAEAGPAGRTGAAPDHVGDVEWVINRRPRRVSSVNAVALIRQMRDEETH